MPKFKCNACRRTNERHPGELKEWWGTGQLIPCLHCNELTGYIVHRDGGWLVDTLLTDGYTEEERLYWWGHFGGRIGESNVLYTIGKYYKQFIKDMIELHGPEWWLWKTSLIAARRKTRKRPELVAGTQVEMF